MSFSFLFAVCLVCIVLIAKGQSSKKPLKDPFPVALSLTKHTHCPPKPRPYPIMTLAAVKVGHGQNLHGGMDIIFRSHFQMVLNKPRSQTCPIHRWVPCLSSTKVLSILILKWYSITSILYFLIVTEARPLLKPPLHLLQMCPVLRWPHAPRYQQLSRSLTPTDSEALWSSSKTTGYLVLLVAFSRDPTHSHT